MGLEAVVDLEAVDMKVDMEAVEARPPSLRELEAADTKVDLEVGEP